MVNKHGPRSYGRCPGVHRRTQIIQSRGSTRGNQWNIADICSFFDKGYIHAPQCAVFVNGS